MASTTLALIHNTLRHLQTGERTDRNQLANAVTAVETTFTFSHDLKGIKAGAKVSIDLEDTYVWSAADASKTAVAQRGDFGSTAAVHSSLAIAQVNPKWSYHDILTAINEELAALSSPKIGLYRPRSDDTITYNPAIQGYELTTVGMQTVQNVYADTPGPDNSQPEIRSWRVIRNAPVGDFPSTVGLVLYDTPYPGQPVRVRYRASFGALSTLADDVVSATGLYVEAHDILEMGAALRLVSGRPIRRSALENQGDTRRATEVSTTDTLQAPGRLAAQYQERIAQECARLQAEYPYRSRV